MTNMYIAINGGKFYKEGTFELNYKDPKFYEGLQKFADLALKYKVAPSIIAEEQAGVVSSWKEFQRGTVSIDAQRSMDGRQTERYERCL